MAAKKKPDISIPVSVELSQAGEFGMRFVLGPQEAERLREVLNDT